MFTTFLSYSFGRGKKLFSIIAPTVVGMTMEPEPAGIALDLPRF